MTSEATLVKVQEDYDKACSQQGSKDENEGVRVLASFLAIGKWFRLEKELTHIEIWRQARTLAITINKEAYGTTDEQAIVCNTIGMDMAKAYFNDAPSNYRGFMKGLGIAGAGAELSPEGKGDLICSGTVILVT